jgi:hypothetical protein
MLRSVALVVDDGIAGPAVYGVPARGLEPCQEEARCTIGLSLLEVFCSFPIPWPCYRLGMRPHHLCSSAGERTWDLEDSKRQHRCARYTSARARYLVPWRSQSLTLSYSWSCTGFRHDATHLHIGLYITYRQAGQEVAGNPSSLRHILFSWKQIST